MRVLNASKKEVLRDLQRAAEFDQSALFKKVYEEEYGVFGGEPFGALIGDYEFTKHPEDIELLEKISHVAAAAHAPFLTAAGPELLSLDSFANLGQPRDIGRIFDSTEYAKWKRFPRERGFPVCRSVPAAHSDASAIRQRHEAGGRLQLRRERGRHRPLANIFGAMPPMPWARA